MHLYEYNIQRCHSRLPVVQARYSMISPPVTHPLSIPPVAWHPLNIVTSKVQIYNL